MTKTSRFLCVGPGGTRCACCFPAPGSRARRAEFRRAKNRNRREVRKQIESETGPDRS